MVIIDSPERIDASVYSFTMRHLLIVYHSQTGRTEALARAAYEGARDPAVENVEVRCLRAAAAGPDDLLWAHALLLGTPENFGYMSGAMKDFFDRTFYPVEGRIQSLPYALFVCAGNDGSGAVRAVRRIANGYPFKEVQEPIVVRGDITPEAIERCRELGMALAAGLDAGVF
jgi:multimeric flavodoxin WrbA